MSAPWSRLLRHLARHGFLRGERRLAPLGRLLLRNLAALWRREVELGLNAPVLPVHLAAGCPAAQPDEIVAECSLLKRALGLVPPFGLSATFTSTQALTAPGHLTAAPPADYDQLTAGSGQLALFMVVPHRSAADWFQTLQRKRRIWWRDLAVDPGNYGLAQPATGVAEVRFGEELAVELLRDHGREPFAENGKLSSSRNQPHLLSCHVVLDAAFWAVCRDSLDGACLRLPERLAPFRRAVLTDDDGSEELRALATHLTAQLRGAGMPVYPFPVSRAASPPSVDPNSNFEFSSSANGHEGSPDCEKTRIGSGSETTSTETDIAGKAAPALESAVRRADAAGVPFCLLLSESTLQDGVCRLRSRDTTLSQQLHVSQAADVT